MALKQLLRRESLWFLGLLGLVSLHFWFPRIQAEINHSHSTVALGKKAVYLTVEALGYRVRRSYSSIDRWAGNLKQQLQFGQNVPHVLCLLGPERYPSASEWRGLNRWIARGGHLVFALREDEFSDRPENWKIDLSSPLQNYVPGGIEAVSSASPLQEEDVQSILVNSTELIWRSSGCWRTGSGTPLIVSGGTLQAVRYGFGRGTLTLVASDWIFSNQSLTFRDNGVVAVKLIATVPPGSTIWFDESSEDSHSPRIAGLLLTPQFRSSTIQLAIVAFLFCWYGNRRFGPVKKNGHLGRSNILDHVNQVGQQMHRSKASNWAVRAYLNKMMHDLKMNTSRRGESQVLESLAIRMNQPAERLKNALKRARKAANFQGLDRNTATRVIRQLARIRVEWSSLRTSNSGKSHRRE